MTNMDLVEREYVIELYREGEIRYPEFVARMRRLSVADDEIEELAGEADASVL